MTAIYGFINPFETDGDDLLCLSSGQKLPDDAAKKSVALEKDGKEASKEFANDRLQNKRKEFHDPIQRNKVATFSSLQKVVRITPSKNKIVKVDNCYSCLRNTILTC